MLREEGRRLNTSGSPCTSEPLLRFRHNTWSQGTEMFPSKQTCEFLIHFCKKHLSDAITLGKF